MKLAVNCQVSEIKPVTEVVSQVTLQPQQYAGFLPGQYLSVVMGEDDKRPFSIANPPRQNGSIELHIGAEPGNEYAGAVLQKMREQGDVQAQIGLGDAYVRDQAQMPIILLAGGTGFSYCYAILQHLINQDYQQSFTLYWGTRTLQDMYACNALQQLAASHTNFSFVPVIENHQSDWQGKSGWVHKAVMHDFTDLSGYQVYVAGRFEMAKVVRDDFAQHRGLKRENLYGDAYAFI